LSNTNELFWERFRTTDIFEFFHLHFPSFELGMLKPDPGIYQQVLHSTGLNAEQILFFDDFLPNVEAARKTGIQAYRVVGFQDLELQLGKLGIL
jgi:putative hydrolase of the HAD superfamily